MQCAALGCKAVQDVDGMAGTEFGQGLRDFRIGQTLKLA